MSNRPRSHQIEDQSRIAFEARLPKEWVYRPVRPDYGIDGSVEIFDENGHGTGKHFNVQLKATDDPDLADALSVKLKLDRCEYYRRLDVPLLIARFHAPTKAFFVKWFHEFDPYYSRGGKKTITFRLSANDKWSAKTALKLSLELEKISRLKSHTLPTPVLFRVQCRDDSVLPVAEVALALRRVLKSVPGVLSLTSEASAAYGTISLSKQEIAVDLAGIHGCTFHLPRVIDSKRFRESVPKDILIATGLALDHLGYSNLGAKLLAKTTSDSSLVKHPEIAIRIAQCLARAHRFREAISLSESLLGEPQNRLLVQALMISVLSRSTVLSKEERELLLQFLERNVEETEKSNAPAVAATANYNLGNQLRSLSNPKALHFYNKAAKFDPKYLERNYFYHELGGILFGLKRYRVSARMYQRALELGADGITIALYADALMFSGRYKEAQEQFEKYIATTQEPKAEFSLKAFALQVLQSMLMLGEQQRNKSTAVQLASFDPRLTPDEFVTRLQKALTLDALCGQAWFNLGAFRNKQNRLDEAFVAFLFAALIERGDAVAWANAFALAISVKQYQPIASTVFVGAYSSCGDIFIEQLFMLVNMQPGQFPKAKFLTAVNDLLSHIHEEVNPFQLRLLLDDGNVKALTLNPREVE